MEESLESLMAKALDILKNNEGDEARALEEIKKNSMSLLKTGIISHILDLEVS